MPVIPQTIYAVVLFVWLALFLAAKWQYDRLRKRTIEMALAKAEELMRRDRSVTVEQCFEALLPDWKALLKQTTWFIPHKTELWPMPATPDYVRRRMNLTPLWLGALLSLHGFHLQAAPDLQSQIDQLVNRTERERKQREAAGRS